MITRATPTVTLKVDGLRAVVRVKAPGTPVLFGQVVIGAGSRPLVLGRLTKSDDGRLVLRLPASARGALVRATIEGDVVTRASSPYRRVPAASR